MVVVVAVVVVVVGVVVSSGSSSRCFSAWGFRVWSRAELIMVSDSSKG